MGWTTMYREPGQSDRDFFQRELSSGKQILECATIRNVFYAAVRTMDTGEIWALVVLLHRAPKAQHNFGYKDMDETVGPNDCDAPARILDLLTPTESEWANEWRARCRERIAAKAARSDVKPGDLVRFGAPLTFADGAVLGELEFVGRNTFRCGGRRYRIANWRNMPYGVVPAGTHGIHLRLV